VINCVRATCGAARLGTANRQLMDLSWSSGIASGDTNTRPNAPALSATTWMVSFSVVQAIWTDAPAHAAPVLCRT